MVDYVLVRSIVVFLTRLTSTLFYSVVIVGVHLVVRFFCETDCIHCSKSALVSLMLTVAKLRISSGLILSQTCGPEKTLETVIWQNLLFMKIFCLG